MDNVLPTILIDTREQLPYSFPGYPVERCKLDTADYTVKGFESQIMIERKSLTDLLGCIFTERFHKQLDRMRTCQVAQLVIEANLYKIQNAHWYKGNSKSVLGMLQVLPIRYGVYPMFLDNREEAERYTLGTLTKFHKEMLKGVVQTQ